jgi:hypothetical protein
VFLSGPGRLETMRYVLSRFSYPDKDHHVIGRPIR